MAGTRRLVNLSTRGSVGVGGEPLTAGFVVAGALPRRILVRGVGPGLGAFGVAGVIANPRVRLYQEQSVLRTNDNWYQEADAASIGAAAATTGAFPLGAQSLDAAFLIVLEPGAYTAQVDNQAGVTGIGLVEVYEVP
jgi:hypothetical protein